MNSAEYREIIAKEELTQRLLQQLRTETEDDIENLGPTPQLKAELAEIVKRQNDIKQTLKDTMARMEQALMLEAYSEPTSKAAKYRSVRYDSPPRVEPIAVSSMPRSYEDEPVFPPQDDRREFECLDAGAETPLGNFLLETGLKRCATTGDGSCLYNAISLALHGTEVYALDYKRIAVWQHLMDAAIGGDDANYISDIEKEVTRRDGTKKIVYLTPAQYIAEVSKPGVWGDQPQIFAIVKALNNHTPGRNLCIAMWKQKEFNTEVANRGPQWDPLDNVVPFRLEYGYDTEFATRCKELVNLYYTGYHYEVLVPV